MGVLRPYKLTMLAATLTLTFLLAFSHPVNAANATAGPQKEKKTGIMSYLPGWKTLAVVGTVGVLAAIFPQQAHGAVNAVGRVGTSLHSGAHTVVKSLKETGDWATDKWADPNYKWTQLQTDGKALGNNGLEWISDQWKDKAKTVGSLGSSLGSKFQEIWNTPNWKTSGGELFDQTWKGAQSWGSKAQEGWRNLGADYYNKQYGNPDVITDGQLGLQDALKEVAGFPVAPS